MELTEKLASDIADHIYMLGTNVLILSDSDVRLISYACSDRDIYVKSKSPTDVTEDEMQDYNTILYWNVLDTSVNNSIPKDTNSLTYNLLSNTKQSDIAYDYITEHGIQSFNIDTETGTTNERYQSVVDEFKNIWPEIYSNNKDHLGFVYGGPVSPAHFVNITTTNHLNNIKKLVEQGAKKIIVSQIHEMAWIKYFRKTQLIADACRDFIDPENFIILTTCTNAEQSWLEYCTNHFIDFPVSVMECNLIEGACRPDSDSLQVLNKPYDIKTYHKKLYTSLNAGVKRLHRLLLGVELCEQNLIHKGLVSLGNYHELPYIDYRSEVSRSMLANLLPLSLDLPSSESKSIHQTVDISQHKLYDSYFSVVTETQFFSKEVGQAEDIPLPNTIFRSEKTLKPMWFKHPFVVLGPRYYLKNLNELGYRTFHPFIDESYDEIEDDILRLQAIVAEVKKLSAYTLSEWQIWKSYVGPIVEHNYNWISNNDIRISKNYNHMFEM